MKQLDVVEAIGLLLRDRRLRSQFAENREATIVGLGVARAQSGYLREVSIEQLETQAESLIRKRCSEVAELIPEIWARLGSQARSVFGQYAEQSNWPEGHRRHAVDAATFCRYLSQHQSGVYLRSEHQWAEFVAGNRGFSIDLVPDLVVQNQRRWAIQICYRRRGRAQRRAVYLRKPASSRNPKREPPAVRPRVTGATRPLTCHGSPGSRQP